MGEEYDEMPKLFWLIIYGSLVWNRQLLHFVPTSKMPQDNPKDYWFLNRQELDNQLAELKALGVVASGEAFELGKE